MEPFQPASVQKTLTSCSECRRRKAKCDRALPCSHCSRSGRNCFYGTVSRTPLTRRHLTNVEEELSKARALLHQYQKNGSNPPTDGHAESSPLRFNDPTSDIDYQKYLNQASASKSDQSTQSLGIAEAFTTDQMALQPSANAVVAGPAKTGVTSLRASDPARGIASRSISPPFPLETSPAQVDFEWDERLYGSRQSRFIDGMASLTNSANRGYMGVASGAALIRLADITEDQGLEAEESHNENGSRDTVSLATTFPSSQLEPFIDEYFRTYHVSYPIVHEATFRAQFMDIIPKPKSQAWQVLLYIVAAWGAFAASLTTPEIDLRLFEAAKARLSVDMLETGNLTLVQALALISNYVQKRNRPNSGYNYLGLAKRMAMSLGLHKEFPAWRSRPLWLETRRRVYWCLYIFDVGATITFSRPLDLPRGGIEIRLPLNVADSDITTATEKFPSEVQEVTLYTHLRCQSQFHLATSEIYTKLISDRFPSAKEMLQADDSQLVQWLQGLPSFFQEVSTVPPRFRLCHSILQWRWRNFRILMYRPFLMRRFMTERRANTVPPSEWDDRAIKRCLDAAAESVKMITNYWECETQNVLTCWYALYFLFQASLIPVVCLRNEPYSLPAGEWRSLIISALQSISDMVRINSVASRYHGVIMKLCGTYLGQDISEWASPTSETASTQLNALNSLLWPITDPQSGLPYDFGFLDSIPIDFVNQFPE